MDVRFDDRVSAGTMIRAAIEAANSGMCSGCPSGIWYPGVPSVVSVLGEIGAKADEPLTDCQWMAVCEILDPD